MAEYRMIGKSIINTAKFLRLARTVREFYLHLIIWADDAGVTEAFPVMKLIDAKEKDLKILSEKKFIEILDEDEFIVSIVDWEEHNKIPPSKAKESRYTYLLEAKRSEPEAKPYTSSEKKQYAEFVSLTEEEYNKLVDQHGEEATLECVEILDNYKGASGKKYKSDYRAILTWVLDKYRKQHRAKPMEARASPAKNDVQATLAEMRRRIEARYQNDGQAEADPF